MIAFCKKIKEAYNPIISWTPANGWWLEYNWDWDRKVICLDILYKNHNMEALINLSNEFLVRQYKAAAARDRYVLELMKVKSVL